MCSYRSLFEMENYEGDLTDIVRASAGNAHSKPEDQFQPEMAIDFSQQQQPIIRDQYSFGDPFSATIRDPLLHHLDINIMSSSSSSSSFFNVNNNNNNNNSIVPSSIDEDHDQLFKRPPCNIFSRMLQISPASVPNKFPISPCDSPLLGNSPRAPPILNTNSDQLHCFVDNAGLQISSPRTPAGIKRRKSQARKVVCVPAPVAANGRPNGEVIPSDLWAWRKYGQKPIKGSPYPRGYYRCSSSKGCSARKQVERSRTDPNMLVITYTSEHNHPWPTQRNALAGSSRSQQSKNNAASNSSKLSSSSSSNSQPQITASISSTTTTTSHVKEEFIDQDLDKHFNDDQDFNEGFLPYRSSMADQNINQSDDFFADLEEFETDPLHLLFTKGDYHHGQKLENKASLDVSFAALFDWETTASSENNANANSNSNSTSSSSKEPNRGFY